MLNPSKYTFFRDKVCMLNPSKCFISLKFHAVKGDDDPLTKADYVSALQVTKNHLTLHYVTPRNFTLRYLHCFFFIPFSLYLIAQLSPSLSILANAKYLILLNFTLFGPNFITCLMSPKNRKNHSEAFLKDIPHVLMRK